MGSAEARTSKAALAGSLAGAASLVVAFPLDNVRTRVQLSQLRGGVESTWSTAQCARHAVASEGWKGLYRGMLAPLATQAVVKALIFSSFQFASANVVPDLGPERRATRAAMSASMAAIPVSLVLTPVELVRNLLILDSSSGRGGGSSSRGALVRIVREVARGPRGPLGLWRGIGATLLRDGLGLAGYFGAYTRARQALGDSNAALVASGSAGGLAYWVLAGPLDSLKTRVQSSSLSMRQVVASSGSLVSFYKGAGLTGVGRGLLSGAVVFFVQEKLILVL